MRETLKEATYCPETGRRLTPREIRCDCGRGRVVLSSSWANSCPVCDGEYNGSGQALAPREQWGEETGEHESDFNDIGHGLDGNY